MVHFQENLSCKTAYLLSAFNNEDPGVSFISTAAFSLPDDVVKITFSLSSKEIESIRKKLPNPSPVKGSDECRRRCNLFKKN
jgi:hypothetical protein